MTDKELDARMTKEIDSIRAGDSVKGRILNDLEGDIMKYTERNDSVIMEIAENSKKTEQKKGAIRISHAGRSTAAAAALVIAVGGACLMSRTARPDTEDRSGPQSAATAPAITGSTAGSEDLSYIRFQPDGRTVFDKFGENSFVWRLEDGRFLIQQWGNYYGGQDSSEGLYDYIVYDPYGEKELTEIAACSDRWRIRVYDSGFSLEKAYMGDEFHQYRTECTFYDLYHTGSRDFDLTVADPESESIVSPPVFFNGGEKMFILSDFDLYLDNGEFKGSVENFHSEETGHLGITENENYAFFTRVTDYEDRAVGIIEIRPVSDGLDGSLPGLKEDEDQQFITLPAPAQEMRFHSYGDTIYGVDPVNEQVCVFDPTDPGEPFTDHYSTFPLPDFVKEKGMSFAGSLMEKNFLVISYECGSENHTLIYDAEKGELLEDYITPSPLRIEEGQSNIVLDPDTGDTAIRTTDPQTFAYSVYCLNFLGQDYNNFGLPMEDPAAAEGTEENEVNAVTTAPAPYDDPEEEGSLAYTTVTTRLPSEDEVILTVGDAVYTLDHADPEQAELEKELRTWYKDKRMLDDLPLNYDLYGLSGSQPAARDYVRMAEFFDADGNYVCIGQTEEDSLRTDRLIVDINGFIYEVGPTCPLPSVWDSLH